MRKIETWKNLKCGDVRIKSWFAILPVSITIGDEIYGYIKETRWLEKVTVKQRYYHRVVSYGPDISTWINIEFV